MMRACGSSTAVYAWKLAGEPFWFVLYDLGVGVGLVGQVHQSVHVHVNARLLIIGGGAFFVVCVLCGVCVCV